MVSFWWTCLPSYKHCMQSWQVLDDHLHHLLLMMSDCTLAIRHKKTHIWMEIGGFFFFFFFGSFGAFRLYRDASLCTYFWLILYLLFDVFIFYELYMIGGDIIFLFLFLVSHCATLIIDLYL